MKNFRKRMFRNEKQKMLGILLAGKSLGSTRNEMHPGMQYGGFSCLPTLADFGHIYIFFQNTICQNVQTKTSSKFTEFFLWRKARSTNQHNTYNAHWSCDQKNMEVSGIMERKVQMAPVWWKGKQNVSQVLQGICEWKKHAIFPDNIPWQSKQITFKLTA